MNKINAVICMGGGKSQLPLIKEILSLNLALIVIDRNKKSPGFKYASKFIAKSTYDSLPIIKKLKILIKQYNFIGIVNRSSGIPVITTSQIANFLKDCAGDLHAYYNDTKFLVENEIEKKGRLALIYATQNVLKNGLTLLGISAPNTM